MIKLNPYGVSLTIALLVTCSYFLYLGDGDTAKYVFVGIVLYILKGPIEKR